MAQVLVIGNGISGSTAAIEIRNRSDLDITMISDEGLQPYARTALMYLFMGQLRMQDIELHPEWFWVERKIKRILALVKCVDTLSKTVELDDGQRLSYDILIVASGSKPNLLGCPGVELEGVGGLYHRKDLERMEYHCNGLQRAVVVGGGLIGVEMAEMFASRHIPVTFLVRENSFCNHFLPEEESNMVTQHLLQHGIDLKLDTELIEIEGDEQGKVCAVCYSGDNRVSCGFVGITTGVSPNLPPFEPIGSIATNKGILVDEFLQSSVPGIFAIGDCAELTQTSEGRKSIEAVWYTGKMMGKVAAANICGEKMPYLPGTWYNSAKFFDLEYQVYGNIPLREEAATGSLFWKHPSGKKSIRIAYQKSDALPVIGFNLIGIRYRQKQCIDWIERKTPLKTVLANLKSADFDSEFSDSYQSELMQLYNDRLRLAQEAPIEQPKNRSWLFSALFKTTK